MDGLTAIISLIAITCFIALSFWYFRRIRAGRAAPYVNPSWPTAMRPSSPIELQSAQHVDRQTSVYNDDSRRGE